MKIQNLSPRNQILILVAITLILRVGLALIFGTEVADLAQYHGMADIVGRGENIYETPGLFHYSPIPMFLPYWSLQVSLALNLPFHFVVKWPMILADLGITLLLWWQARKRGLEDFAFIIALAYVFNPVSLLTTDFHGSYSVLPAFFVLLAYCLITLEPERRYYRLSALSLGLAIGLRAYPVLYLPFILRKMNLEWRRKIAYLVLAGLPSLITFIPYLLVNFQTVWRDVFSYSGVADCGWVAVARSYWFLKTQNLYLPGTLGLDLINISKWIFLAAYALFVVIFWWKHKHFSMLSGILGTLLLFFGLYGGISSQYLIWVIPFALLFSSRWEKAYTWTATANLIFFYLFFFPTILFGDLPIVWPDFMPQVMILRLVSALAFWVVCLAWFAWIMRYPPPDLALKKSITEGILPAELSETELKTHRFPGWSWRLAAELILVAYIGLVLALGSQQMKHRLYLLTQAKQNLQVELVGTVEKIDSGFEEFNAPVNLLVDPAGNFYVANWNNHRLQKFSPDGARIAEWFGDDAGLYPFVEPYGLAVDPDGETIWVLDSGNGWIYKLKPDGKLEAMVDGAKVGVYNPRGLAISKSGDIYVADTGSARILHLDPQGNLIAAWGSAGSAADQFQDPSGITIQDDQIFVVDANNKRIVHYDLNGNLIGYWEVGPIYPWIAIDGMNRIFVGQIQPSNIFIYGFDGKLVNVLQPGKEIQQLDRVMGFTVTKDDRLYILGPTQLTQYKITR